MLSSTSAGVKQAYDFEEVDCKFIYSLDVRRLFESENVGAKASFCQLI